MASQDMEKSAFPQTANNDVKCHSNACLRPDYNLESEMASQDMMERSFLPKTLDKEDRCHSNGYLIPECNGESGLVSMEMDKLREDERLMGVLSGPKSLNEPDMVYMYSCRRCEDLYFRSRRKLAVHYEDNHPGNDRELQSISAVKRKASGKKVATRRPPPTAKRKKIVPAAIGRPPASGLSMPLSSAAGSQHPPLSNLFPPIGVPTRTNDRPPGESACAIPSELEETQPQTVQESQSLRKRKRREMASQDMMMGTSVLPQTSDENGKCCSNGYHNLTPEYNGESGLVSVDHEVDNLRNERLMEVLSCFKSFDEPDIAYMYSYSCKRCSDLHFTSRGQLAVHYENDHPGNQRELQLIRAVKRIASGKKGATSELSPARATKKDKRPTSMGRPPVSKGKSTGPFYSAVANKTQPLKICFTKISPSSERQQNVSSIGISSDERKPHSGVQGHQSIRKQQRRCEDTVAIENNNYSEGETTESKETCQGSASIHHTYNIGTQYNVGGNQTSITGDQMNTSNQTDQCIVQARPTGTAIVSDSDLGDMIKLLGPADLQNLFINLGIRFQDIEKAESSAGTTDVGLRARKVLQMWLKINGQQATRGALLKALDKCENMTAKEKLEKSWKLKGIKPMLEPSAEDVASAGVPPVDYNYLCLNICNMLTGKQLKTMKFLLKKDPRNKQGIPTNAIQAIDTTEELLTCMENFNYLDSTNLWFLQYLLYCAGSKALYKKVFKYVTNRLISSDALYVFQPNEIRGARNASVKLKVTGNVHKFRPIEVEEFRQLLAQQCGTDIEYVCVVGEVQGSVILYFQVPLECKQFFLASIPALTDWCKKYGILQVCFDDDEIVALPQVDPEESSKCVKNADVILDVLKDDVDNVKNKLSTLSTADLRIGGKTLLHLATELNNQATVKYLISRGAKVDETDEVKATALHMAVFLNYPQVCKKLLENTCTDVNAVDKLGNSPLHLASNQGNFILCALLMDHRALTDIKNQEGQTACDVANSGNFMHVLNLMINNEIEHWTVSVNEYTLLCPICHCSFKKPRILPCGHSFCENCLETQLQTSNVKESLECCMCKQKAIIPDCSDITQFPINEPLDTQVEEARHIHKLKKQKAAQVSNDRPSTEMDPKDKNEEMVEDVTTEATTSEGARETKVSDDMPSIEMDPKAENEEMFEDTNTEAISKGAKEAKQSEVCDKKDEQSPVGDIEHRQQATVHVTRVTIHSLSCPACHEMFTKPVRKLSCSHSFCEVCLKELIQEEMSCITCLVCQEETLVPEGGVTKLLHDTNLQNQVDDANQYNKVNQFEIVTDIGGPRPDWKCDEDLTIPVDDECPICHCSFTKRRLLPCGHNFCENCLETQLQASNVKESLECCMCKQKTIIPDGDIMQLPIDKSMEMCGKEAGYMKKWDTQKKEEDSGNPATCSPQEARKLTIQRCIQSLVHACQCRDANCRLPSCQKMKRVVQHTKGCKRKTNGGCPICKQLIALCCYHAKHCTETKCMVPFCLDVKHKLRQQQLQHRLQQAQLLRLRMATMAQRTATTAQIPSQTSTPAVAQTIDQQVQPQQMATMARQKPQTGPPSGAFKSAQQVGEADKQATGLSPMIQQQQRTSLPLSKSELTQLPVIRGQRSNQDQAGNKSPHQSGYVTV